MFVWRNICWNDTYKNCIKFQSLKKNGQQVTLIKISLNERLFLHLTNWSLRTTPLTAVVWSGITISASLEQVKTQLCFIVIQCLVRFLKWLTVACSGLGNLTNIEGLALTCPRSSPPPSCRAWTHLPANPWHKKNFQKIVFPFSFSSLGCISSDMYSSCLKF